MQPLRRPQAEEERGSKAAELPKKTTAPPPLPVRRALTVLTSLSGKCLHAYVDEVSFKCCYSRISSPEGVDVCLTILACR